MGEKKMSDKAVTEKWKAIYKGMLIQIRDTIVNSEKNDSDTLRDVLKILEKFNG